MKTASLMIAAFALTTGLAFAQTETSAPQPAPQGQSPSQPSQPQLGQPSEHENGGVRTGYGQDRRVKTGTDQTYNTGATGESVGKDQPAPVTGQDQGAATTAGANRAEARGTGVATGFVAAGLGLAILGLFVRRKGRHDDDEDDYGGGSGTQTRS